MWRAIWATLMAIGGLIVVASQTRPEDAVSNIAAWVNYLGGHAPDWMQTPGVDTVAAIVGALIAVISAFLAWRFWSRKKPSTSTSVSSAEKEAETPSTAADDKAQRATACAYLNEGILRFKGLRKQEVKTEEAYKAWEKARVIIAENLIEKLSTVLPGPRVTALFSTHAPPLGRGGSVRGAFNNDHSGSMWTMMYRESEMARLINQLSA